MRDAGDATSRRERGCAWPSRRERGRGASPRTRGAWRARARVARQCGVRSSLGSAAAISAAALLAASGWLVTRAAEQPPVLALLAAIVVVRAVGLVRAFARYGERIAGHDVAFSKLATCVCAGTGG